MTSFSEQLSAVRTSQWEAQLDIFRKLSDRALDSTEQLIALNLKTSRASMEQAAGTVKQLLEVSDPRDLLAVGSAAQGQLQHMFNYGRELLGIASGMRPAWNALPPPVQSAPMRLEAPPAVTAPSAPAQPAKAAVAAAAPQAEAVAAQPAEAVVAPRATIVEQVEAAFEASVDSAIADEVPPAAPTPLAKALNEAAPKPASVEHPIVSTVPLEAEAVELPAVAPAAVTPPVAVRSQGPQAKAPRPSRKK